MIFLRFSWCCRGSIRFPYGERLVRGLHLVLSERGRACREILRPSPFRRVPHDLVGLVRLPIVRVVLPLRTQTTYVFPRNRLFRVVGFACWVPVLRCMPSCVVLYDCLHW